MRWGSAMKALFKALRRKLNCAKLAAWLLGQRR